MKVKATKLKNKIRQATLADLGQIYEIDRTVHSNPWTLNAIKEEIENPSNKNIILTTEDSQVIGYFFLRLGLDFAEVMILGIHSHYQKQGLGEYLMREGLKACPQEFKVFLEVSALNKAALSLYKKLGFEVISIRKAYYNDASDALCMALNVN